MGEHADYITVYNIWLLSTGHLLALKMTVKYRSIPPQLDSNADYHSLQCLFHPLQCFVFHIKLHGKRRYIHGNTKQLSVA